MDSQPSVARSSRHTLYGRLTLILWAGAALIVSMLLFRFGLRALGVRPDIAFPGLIYMLTGWIVQPFYAFFPLPSPYGERFDTPIVEAASLGASGAVLLLALVVYVAALLLSRPRERTP